MRCSRLTIGLLVAVLIAIIVVIVLMTRKRQEGVTIPPQPSLVRPANEYESGELDYDNPFHPTEVRMRRRRRRRDQRPQWVSIGLATTGRDGTVLQLLTRPLDVGHGVFEYMVQGENGVLIPVYSRRGHYVELEDGDVIDVIGYKKPMTVRIF